MKGDAPFTPRGPVFLLDTVWAGAGGPPSPAIPASASARAMPTRIDPRLPRHRKLGVADRTQAVKRGRELGIL